MRTEPSSFFSSQFGDIYPDNLWVFAPPVSPPDPTKKIYGLWLSTILVMIEQRDYVTVNYSVTSKLHICKFPMVQSYF